MIPYTLNILTDWLRVSQSGNGFSESFSFSTTNEASSSWSADRMWSMGFEMRNSISHYLNL